MKYLATILSTTMRGALAVILGLSLLVPAIPQQANAALNVPQVIMYQGRLTDANRITVDDGTYDMIFTIWDHVTDNDCGTDNLYVSGGTCGTPTATSVTVTDGVFTVALGSDTAALSDDLFDDAASNDFYLEINIEGETLSPRRQIGATAFALQAGDSHLLDDKAASATGCTGACIPATDSNGNLLITGDPQGSAVSQGSLYINPASPGAGEVIFGVANGGSTRFLVNAEGDGRFVGNLAVVGGLQFGNSGRISNGTSGIISFNSSLVPDTDDTYDLGTSTARWQDLYLGPNSLHIGTDGNEGILSFVTADSVFNFDSTVRFDANIRPETANTSDSGDDGHRWQDLYVEDNGGIHIGDAGGEAADTEALINLSSGDLAFTSDDGFVFNIDDDNLGDDVVNIDNEEGYALQVSRTGSNTGTGNYYAFDATIDNSTNEVDNTRAATIDFTRSGTVDTNTGGHSIQEARGLYVDYTATHDLDAALSGVQLANRGIEIAYTETSSNAGDATNEENVGLLVGMSSDSSSGRVHGIQIDVDSSITGQGGDGLKSESAIAITRGGIWLEGDGNTSFDITSDVTGMGGDGTIFSGGDIEIYDGALCVGNASTGGEECSGALTDGTIYAVNTTVQGVDLAEMYPSAEALMPGDIVSVSDDGDEFVAASEQGDTLIGAISTAPGLTLGRETAEDGYFPVALAGRVPVRVNDEGGAINIGDRIAVSSQTGIGMRATEASEVVGIAMQAAPFAGSSTDAIVVFVQPHYWNGVEASASVTEQEPEPVVNATQAFALSDLETSTIAALSGYNWSIDADGIFNTDGYYAVTIKSSQNTRVETYGVLGMEHYVTLAGTTRVENGMAWVDFELLAPEFNDVIDTAAPIIVTVTPSDGEGVAYVTDKSGSGFQLHLANGSFATQVDWMVMAYRLNFPPGEPEEEQEEESEEEKVDVSEEEDVENVGEESEEEGAEEEPSSEGADEEEQEDVSGDEVQEEDAESAESDEEAESAENSAEESPVADESTAPEQGEEELETENAQETEVTPSDESDQSTSSSEEEAST